MNKKVHLKPWQKYESRAYNLFCSTGHECQRNVVLSGARGSHQIDIVVNLNVSIGHHRWLVECKHWSRLVGKSIVHGFKTVIDDIGADHGYLLSKKGFQRGAREIAQTFNISLCTLSELQKHFVQEQLSPQYQQSSEFRVVIRYTEDCGMGDPEAELELIPINNLSVADNIIEIHVLQKGQSNWVISNDSDSHLINADGRLIFSLPWDLMRIFGLDLKSIDVDSLFRVVFRTLTGPVSAEAVIPLYK